jgi:hypothetical protein
VQTFTRNRAASALLVALVTGLAAACAETEGGSGMPGVEDTPTPSAATPSVPPPSAPPSSASTRPPLSSTVLPTRGPAKPPKTPSDLVPHDVIVGRVTRGGTGPCYGLVTDDDVEYAMYSAAGPTLREGSTVRVRFEPLLLKINCGPGRHISAVEVAVLG